MYERIQQLPVDTRKGHDAIFEGSYLNDIPAVLKEWEATRVLLVVSTTLDTKSEVIKDLEASLGSLAYLDKKVGVGSHSPYADTIDIAHRVQQNSIDAVVCIGSGSYSDSCKTAVMLSATLSPGFSYEDMESLVDQTRGLAGPENLKSPTTKLICVPTSLSSGEWNHYASGTNSKGKKQHFVHEDGAPTLILCDPRVAATMPRGLWLASGMRAVDHFVETLCSPKFTHEAAPYVKSGLGNLLKGIVEYCENKSGDQPSEGLLQGISDCQRGSRLALFAWIFMKVAFGTSHALGHQLGSYARVQHGITSCILLPPVLAYTETHTDVKIRQGSHAEVLSIFNETLGWNEKSASDAVARLVGLLGLPSHLHEVGVTADDQIQRIAELATTDVLGEYGILPPLEGIKTILNTVR